MIHGIGTDIVSVSRIARALARYGDRFVKRILVAAEAEECAAAAQPARFLAKRFAVKEAYSKAYGTGIGAELSWHDIAVAHDSRGKPCIVPSTALAGRLKRLRLADAQVSLADEVETAIAFVIIEKEP
ncbi:MAG: holo-ACP synthase [Betaproteobacteria bacterium]|nr:holo-ACP synthase [Betaproteobacteria bacterium]